MTINVFKTNNYKRFARCEDLEECDFSYGLPKRGKIYRTGVYCPGRCSSNNKEKENSPGYGIPILVIEKTDSRPYFWTDIPFLSFEAHFIT